MSEVRIREARPADAEVLAQIHVRSWQDSYRGIVADAYLDALTTDERLPRWRESLANPPEAWVTWVAEAETGVIGFAVTGRSQDADAETNTAEVFAIYMDPDAADEGVGSELLAYAVEDLRRRGYREATLWVLESNDGARRFYERVGWSTDGAAATELIGEQLLPTVRYRFILS